MTIPAEKPLTRKFPKAETEKFVTNWWTQQEEARARRGNPFGDAKTRNENVFSIQPQLSSLEAVAILTRLSAVLGFEPSKSVIKKGGYNDVRELVQDLLPQLENQFVRKK